MIFQSLIALYERQAKMDKIPSYGFSDEDIGFVISIDKEGNLIGQPEDLRTKIKANIFDFRKSVVPYTNQVNVRSGNASATPNFMVDKADYIFGMSGTSKKDVHHQSFNERIDEVCGESNDEGVLAAKAFLAGWKQEDSVELRDWKEICGTHGKWVAFRLQGDSGFIHERQEVKNYGPILSPRKSSPRESISWMVRFMLCNHSMPSLSLVPELHWFRLMRWLTNPTEKRKGENAPISVEAEFKSSAALKFLLRSKIQRLRIGDATTVFWAEQASPVETFMGQILNPSIEDEAAAVPVQKFLEAVRQGSLPKDLEGDKNLKFYILGLSLNKARLALRFWHVCTVSELMDRFRDHFNNLEMERSDRDIPFPGVWHLLKETAREQRTSLRCWVVP